MKTTQRSYSEEAGDFARLCELMVTGRREAWRSMTWCLGRIVDWRYGLWGDRIDDPGYHARNARLWFDGFGGLAGLAVSEGGGPEIAVLTTPGYRFLFGEILDWALAAWAGRGPRLTTELTDEQELEARALEERGFRRGGPYFTRRFDLTAPPGPPPPLEPGFSIVDMRAHPDYRGRRILRSNAFEHHDDLGEEELTALLRVDALLREAPTYHPDTDVCVMAPDGRLVASCEALIDARNAEADLERICTHSAFRNRGLARAAIVACMGRLCAMGIRCAYITGYSDAALSLYGSLGHVEELRCWTYERA
jgi:hypothetical protein